MACTLKELQNAEYEILCQFADYCDARNIPYGLSGGTLLGAVRHNGFIPWDDDIDIHMEVHAFQKFVRSFKRQPIPGLHLTWIDTDAESPFFFAKLKKDGTYMPETAIQGLDTHSGIWLDLFCFTGVNPVPPLAKLQKKALYYFRLAGHLFAFQHDPTIEHSLKNTALFRFSLHLSNDAIRRIRKILFSLYAGLGSRRSETLLYNDWTEDEKVHRVRSDELPLCKHVFGAGEFWIPQNYDTALTKQYGDYMTPKEFPCHTNLSEIRL